MNFFLKFFSNSRLDFSKIDHGSQKVKIVLLSLKWFLKGENGTSWHVRKLIPVSSASLMIQILKIKTRSKLSLGTYKACSKVQCPQMLFILFWVISNHTL